MYTQMCFISTSGNFLNCSDAYVFEEKYSKRLVLISYVSKYGQSREDSGSKIVHATYYFL